MFLTNSDISTKSTTPVPAFCLIRSVLLQLSKFSFEKWKSYGVHTGEKKGVNIFKNVKWPQIVIFDFIKNKKKSRYIDCSYATKV